MGSNADSYCSNVGSNVDSYCSNVGSNVDSYCSNVGSNVDSYCSNVGSNADSYCSVSFPAEISSTVLHFAVATQVSLGGIPVISPDSILDVQTFLTLLFVLFLLCETVSAVENVGFCLINRLHAAFISCCVTCTGNKILDKQASKTSEILTCLVVCTVIKQRC